MQRLEVEIEEDAIDSSSLRKKKDDSSSNSLAFLASDLNDYAEPTFRSGPSITNTETGPQQSAFLSTKVSRQLDLSSTPLPYDKTKINEVKLYKTSKQPLLQAAKIEIPISNCSGKKKAVLIGINYIGMDCQLNGCINDANNMADFIKLHYGFVTRGTAVLTDDGKADGLPTKANILQAMHWLVEDAKPNDSLFFHFSGHGDQQKDLHGDEADGYDEIILPLDFEKSGVITDDEMNEIMVRSLPKGCRLTAIFDCCHSGSSLDLPYIYDEKGALTKVSSGFNPQPLDFKRFFNLCICSFVPKRSTVRSKSKPTLHATQTKVRHNKRSLADVVMLSRDTEKSYDLKLGGSKGAGILTYAILSVLFKNPHNTRYIELLAQVRFLISEKDSQIPQLSSGRPLNLEDVFGM